MSIAYPPLVNDPDVQVAYLSVRLVALAETFGLLPPTTGSGVDRANVETAIEAFARVGIGRRGAVLRQQVTPERRADALRELLLAVEESPVPELEWASVTRLLGDDLVTKLVGASVSSVHRYRSGERSTPDEIAARLHTVALISADLAGSYNDFGIRRWFQRRRTALGGMSPTQVLSGDWLADDERVEEVRTLAGALLGSPAT